MRGIHSYPHCELLREFGVFQGGGRNGVRTYDAKGNVRVAFDLDLRSYILDIRGATSSTSYFGLPKSRSQSLNVKAPLLYIILTPGPAGSAPMFALHLEMYLARGQRVKVSVSNLFRTLRVTPSFAEFPYSGPMGEWIFFAISLPDLVQQYFPGGQYQSLRSIRLNCNCLVRSIYTSHVSYTLRNLPKESCLPVSYLDHNDVPMVYLPDRLEMDLEEGVEEGLVIDENIENADDTATASMFDGQSEIRPQNSPRVMAHSVNSANPAIGTTRDVSVVSASTLPQVGISGSREVRRATNTGHRRSPLKERVNNMGNQSTPLNKNNSKQQADVAGSVRKQTFQGPNILRLCNAFGVSHTSRPAASLVIAPGNDSVAYVSENVVVISKIHTDFLRGQAGILKQRFLQGHRDTVTAFCSNSRANLWATACGNASVAKRMEPSSKMETKGMETTKIVRVSVWDDVEIGQRRLSSWVMDGWRCVTNLEFAFDGTLLHIVGQDSRGGDAYEVWELSNVRKKIVFAMAKATSSPSGSALIDGGSLRCLKAFPGDRTRSLSCGTHSIKRWRIRTGPYNVPPSHSSSSSGVNALVKQSTVLNDLRSYAVSIPKHMNTWKFVDIAFPDVTEESNKDSSASVNRTGVPSRALVSCENGCVVVVSLASLVAEFVVHLHNLGRDGTVVFSPTRTKCTINSIAIRGPYTITGAEDGLLRIWDTQSLLKTVGPDRSTPVNLEGGHEESRVGSAENSTSAELLFEAEHEAEVSSVQPLLAVDVDRSQAVDANIDAPAVVLTKSGNLGVLELSQPAYLLAMTSPAGVIRQILPLPKRTKLAVLDATYKVALWDMVENRQSVELLPPTVHSLDTRRAEVDPVTALGSDTDESLLFVGHRSGRLRIFDMYTTSMLNDFVVREATDLDTAFSFATAITSIAAHPQTDCVYVACANGSISLHLASRDYEQIDMIYDALQGQDLHITVPHPSQWPTFMMVPDNVMARTEPTTGYCPLLYVNAAGTGICVCDSLRLKLKAVLEWQNTARILGFKVASAPEGSPPAILRSQRLMNYTGAEDDDEGLEDARMTTEGPILVVHLADRRFHIISMDLDQHGAAGGGRIIAPETRLLSSIYDPSLSLRSHFDVFNHCGMTFIVATMTSGAIRVWWAGRDDALPQTLFAHSRSFTSSAPSGELVSSPCVSMFRDPETGATRLVTGLHSMFVWHLADVSTEVEKHLDGGDTDDTSQVSGLDVTAERSVLGADKSVAELATLRVLGSAEALPSKQRQTYKAVASARQYHPDEFKAGDIADDEGAFPSDRIAVDRDCMHDLRELRSLVADLPLADERSTRFRSRGESKVRNSGNAADRKPILHGVEMEKDRAWNDGQVASIGVMVASGQLGRNIRGFPAPMHCWNQSTGLFAYASGSQCVVEDLTSRHQTIVNDHTVPINNLVASSCGQYMATASPQTNQSSCQVRVYRSADMRCLHSFVYHRNYVSCMAFSNPMKKQLQNQRQGTGRDEDYTDDDEHFRSGGDELDAEVRHIMARHRNNAERTRQHPAACIQQQYLVTFGDLEEPLLSLWRIFEGDDNESTELLDPAILHVQKQAEGSSTGGHLCSVMLKSDDAISAVAWHPIRGNDFVSCSSKGVTLWTFNAPDLHYRENLQQEPRKALHDPVTLKRVWTLASQSQSLPCLPTSLRYLDPAGVFLVVGGSDGCLHVYDSLLQEQRIGRHDEDLPDEGQSDAPEPYTTDLDNDVLMPVKIATYSVEESAVRMILCATLPMCASDGDSQVTRDSTHPSFAVVTAGDDTRVHRWLLEGIHSLRRSVATTLGRFEAEHGLPDPDTSLHQVLAPTAYNVSALLSFGELQLDGAVSHGDQDDVSFLSVIGTDRGSLWYVHWEENEMARLVSSHQGPILDCTVMETDGPGVGFAASAGEDGTVRLWDLSTLDQTLMFEVKGYAATAIAIAPPVTRGAGLRQLSAGYSDGSVRIIDMTRTQLFARLHPFPILESPLEEHSLDQRSNAVTALHYVGNGQTLIAGSKSGHLAVISATSGITLSLLSDHAGSPITSLAGAKYVPPSKSLGVSRHRTRDEGATSGLPQDLWTAASQDRRVSVWQPVSGDMGTHEKEHTNTEPFILSHWFSFPGLPKDEARGIPSLVALPADRPGHLLFTGSTTAVEATEYAIATQQRIRTHELTHRAQCWDFHAVPAGERDSTVVLGATDRAVSSMSLRTGERRDFLAHCTAVASVCVYDEGRKALSAGADGIKVWSLT
eukprot:Clim_evm41s214 gene=Clim_evmTU41s214